ncbi:phytochrome-like protein cph2 [Moorella thermoacetica]|uniref:Phytochrome-like protein cph2 n=1 Tax=Neomoorella thermoacetica TaxID=1525 RepID=A0A1J5JER4_NEOTH|nr:phytochrome-like protein cph2 [Moorella thermoacetica]
MGYFSESRLQPFPGPEGTFFGENLASLAGKERHAGGRLDPHQVFLQENTGGEGLPGGRSRQRPGGAVRVETFIDISERKYLEEELYRLSITDPLTGAYNRCYFLEMLEREVERIRRTGNPFSLIMFDLDHFKSINDHFGHAAGDRVLKGVVSAFKKQLRKTDCLARWGGEEFVILLPETGVEGAATLAEELRQKLSEMG